MTGRRPLALLFAVALATAGVLMPSGATADCGGPTVTVRPSSGPPGSSFTVHGTGFQTECNDVNPPPGPQGIGGPPQTGIVVSITDSAFTRTVLATVDAQPDYSFTVTVEVPAEAALGVASVQADGSSPFVPPAPFEVNSGVIPATPAYTG